MTGTMPFLSATLLTLLLLGCTNPVEELAEPTEIDIVFEVYFENDAVTVEIDGLEVFADTMTTRGWLAVAGSTTVTLTSTQHEVTVTMNGDLSATARVRTRDIERVIVSYDRETKRLSLWPTREKRTYL